MKNKNLVYGIVIIILTASAIFIWNNYRFTIQERTDRPITLPPQATEGCGMQNCHGLDMKCGLVDVPQECDLMYAAGDNCRQFASCQDTSGKCELQKAPEFDNCKSCVEKCEENFKDNQIKFFECESKCAK